MTLGMLTPVQALKLKDSGLDYYNHNIDTSPEYYCKIITTRSFQHRALRGRGDAPRRAAIQLEATVRYELPLPWPYCSTCTFSSVTSPLEAAIMGSSAGRKASIFA